MRSTRATLKENARSRVLAPGGSNSALGLERSDVFCLEALRPLGDIELDRLAFLQAAKPACLDGREMHEDIVARLAADKAKALSVIKPLHCSLFHCVTHSIVSNFC